MKEDEGQSRTGDCHSHSHYLWNGKSLKWRTYPFPQNVVCPLWERKGEAEK